MGSAPPAGDAELFGDVLPTYLTRFIGRASELTELLALLGEPGVVTICGIGGVGKTRLAVEAVKRIRAADPSVRVSWVPLATASGTTEVGPSIAHALGLGGAATDSLGRLTTVLGSGRMLLVLDSCEHVASGCQQVLDRIMPVCPQLRVLTSSRVPTGVSGEVIYPVPPLGAASADGEWSTDATALFVDRATVLAPAYALTGRNGPLLAEICRRLDGLPLAIELAASWIRVLSPRDLLTSLTEAEATLAADSAGVVEDRHRSLRAVLDSSWRWLAPAERSVIEALGVFVGGFTREAAEAVAGADLGVVSRLGQLALIQRLPDAYGGSRYHVHELVRTYALSRLQASENVRERHLRYFLGVVDRLGAASNTALEARWSDPAAADIANIDAALSWALDRADAERAQRLAVGLDHFWPLCVPSAEHRLGRLRAALALSGPLTTRSAAHARAQALLIMGRREVGADPARSRLRYREALPLFRSAGDAAGVAACIRDRGASLLAEGDHRGCRRDCLDSLARCRCCGDDQGAAWNLEIIGAAALLAGDWREAVSRLTEAAADFANRDAPLGVCTCELELGLAYQVGACWLESVDASLRALEWQGRHQRTATWGDLLEVVARLCVEQRRWAAAAQLYGAAAGWHSDYDQQSWFPFVARFSLAERARRQLGEQEWTPAYEAGLRLSPSAADRIAAELLTDVRQHLRSGSAGLSAREIEVLRLVAGGLTDEEIAQELVLSPRTVHAHLRSVYRKLDVTSRTAAVRAAGAVVLPPGG